MDNEVLNIMTIEGMDCYEKDGIVYLKLETVAKGLGFTQISGSGNEVVRWERVRKYLQEFNIPTCGDIMHKHTGKNGLPEFIPENVFYRLAMKAKNDVAEKFQAKVADDIIPTIRKTGGYIANDDLFLDTYFPEMEGEARSVFKATLGKLREKNETIAMQDKKIAEQKREIDYKEDVIIALVDNISLAEKRQVLNRVVRHNNSNYQNRWAMLYKEFEDKYHINLKKKLNDYNETHKPKCRCKLDYIDKVMHKIPELYEIATKLFEGDVKELVEEMFGTCDQKGSIQNVR